MSKAQVDFFNTLFIYIRENAPLILDDIPLENDKHPLKITIDKIIKLYNSLISDNKGIESEFKKHSDIGSTKGNRYSSSVSKIGTELEKGIAPNLSDLNLASNYFVKKK